MARPMDNSNRESIYPLVRRALDCWTSHNNVQTSKASSRILMCHALKDYMYQMDMDKHCTLQGMKLHYKHLDNNDQLDTDDSLKTFSKISLPDDKLRKVNFLVAILDKICLTPPKY